jgi:hypothetical protein
MLKLKLIFLIPFFLSPSCSKVKFANDGRIAALEPNPIDIRCEVAAETFTGLNAITLSVSALESVEPDSLYQKTIFNDAAKEGRIQWKKEGAANNGRVTYVLAEGGTSSFTPDAFGKYSLEFSLLEDASGDSPSCDFVVVPPQEATELSCSVDPASVRVGTSPEIKINAGDYNGTLRQEIFPSGSTTDAISVSTLVNQDGVWKRSDGQNNGVLIFNPGVYRIDLTAENNKKTSCELTVAAAGDVCSDDTKPVGTHVAFMIDNSGSNGATDCYMRKDIDKYRYECSGPTKRERAVYAVYDYLKAFAAQNTGGDTEAKARAASKMAITKFPLDPKIEGDQAFQRNPQSESGDGWFNTSINQQDALTAVMSFTRKVYGSTPYYEAITGAKTVFASLKDADASKTKIAILISDAEPTDANPELVVKLADELKKNGVTLITVKLTEASGFGVRLQEHKSMIKEWDDGSPYYPRDIYGEAPQGFDKYFEAVISLPEDVASPKDPFCGADDEGCDKTKLVLPFANIDTLGETLKNIVKIHGVKCQ